MICPNCGAETIPIEDEEVGIIDWCPVCNWSDERMSKTVPTCQSKKHARFSGETFFLHTARAVPAESTPDAARNRACLAHMSGTSNHARYPAKVSHRELSFRFNNLGKSLARALHGATARYTTGVNSGLVRWVTRRFSHANHQVI